MAKALLLEEDSLPPVTVVTSPSTRGKKKHPEEPEHAPAVGAQRKGAPAAGSPALRGVSLQHNAFFRASLFGFHALSS